jgi:hypothetical protein
LLSDWTLARQSVIPAASTASTPAVTTAGNHRFEAGFDDAVRSGLVLENTSGVIAGKLRLEPGDGIELPGHSPKNAVESSECCN